MAIIFTQADWQLFTNLQTLPQPAGVAKHLLYKLAVKELTDNALDTGQEVRLYYENLSGFNDKITVWNGGVGLDMEAAEMGHLFSLRRPLASSKRLRLPLRGALGNGLRVVVATVYCVGGRLELATSGKQYHIITQDDGWSRLEVLGDWAGKGTELRLYLPDNFLGEDVLEWANKAISLNRGNVYAGCSNPYWYDSDSFHHLVMSLPPEANVAELLGLFAKMTPKKVRILLQSYPEHKQPAQSWLNREASEQMLQALRAQCMPLAAQKLGAIGALEDWQAYHLREAKFVLKAAKGSLDAEIPAVIEIFARYAESSHFQMFVNRTPITGDTGLTLIDRKAWLYGCGLNEQIEIPKLRHATDVWINILTPYMPIVSNGKEPDFTVLGSDIAIALKSALQKLKKSETPHAPHTALLSTEKAPSQKEVVLQHLKQAIDKASGNGKYRYSLRQLYYVLRPPVLEATGKELKYDHFNRLITDYEFEQGTDLPGVYRDERGTLLHPHTHEEIKLGTRNVERYHRPEYHFNKILYSEKEGFFEILKEAGFCERYDCALLTSKGFASRAARDVIDLLAETEEELQFFCIHDADLSGTLIYQALQHATRARPQRKVQIINLGLEPWEGLAMGLEVESLERRSTKTPAQYIEEYDADWANPKPPIYERYNRWATWVEWLRSFRIELNAMDTPSFVAWLERKISPYDTGKVVPHQDYLTDAANVALEAQLKAQIRERILTELNIDEMIAQELMRELPVLKARWQELDFRAKVVETLAQSPRRSWREAIMEILGGQA